MDGISRARPDVSLGGFAVKDYSQSGEQKIILDYFGDFRGTFLDAGANDGTVLSNTHALGLLGWRGVLIEPAAMAFEKLRILYSHGTEKWNEDHYVVTTIDAVNQWKWLVQAAITTHDGPVDFWDCGVHLHKGDTSLLSTIRPEELERWKRSGEQFTKTTVRGITVATLMRETGMTRADFVSIDCEGVDLDVLKQLDLTALGTRMVCVEVNRADQKPFDEYCKKHGLRLNHRNYENAIYSRP